MSVWDRYRVFYSFHASGNQKGTLYQKLSSGEIAANCRIEPFATDIRGPFWRSITEKQTSRCNKTVRIATEFGRGKCALIRPKPEFGGPGFSSQGWILS
jgi:hypothetical protein